SDAVRLKETPPISDLYFEPATFIAEGEESPQDGFVVLTDTESSSGEPLYMRYEWEETYMTVAPYPSNFIYNPETGLIELRQNNITQCWLSNESKNLNIETTEGLTDPDIREHPVRYLSFSNSELNHRYSILVKQYAMDAAGYEFWNGLRETNETTGTLFDVL
ncbi:MAG: DUF4249 family protein, partial [Cyclobacteriaceae bacterium]